MEAMEKATRNLEDGLRQLGAIRGDAQELSADETDVQSAIDTVRNINLRIQARQETLAQQLKRIQVDFMIAADMRRETGSTREGSLRPVSDLSSLPGFIDHDGETVRDT